MWHRAEKKSTLKTNCNYLKDAPCLKLARTYQIWITFVFLYKHVNKFLKKKNVENSFFCKINK